ncbi:MAG: hypothetical protein U5R31_00985 [Acidimicrobiia bacterium]|nr:hypothetical protein [Acidimicrobiia bacterium]
MSELVVMKFDSTCRCPRTPSTAGPRPDRDGLHVAERRSRRGRAPQLLHCVAAHTTHGSVTAGAAWGGLAGLFVGILFPPAILGFWAAGRQAGTGQRAG